jgi:hypothetical protein
MAFEVSSETRKIERIQDSFRGHTALTSHSHTPLCELDLRCRMGIGIDAKYAPDVQRPLMPSPIEIEPPWVGIYLYSHFVLRAGNENPVDIEIIARAPQQLTASHMAKDGRVRVRDSAQDAVGLRLTILPELAVYARHNEIKAA